MGYETVAPDELVSENAEAVDRKRAQQQTCEAFRNRSCWRSVSVRSDSGSRCIAPIFSRIPQIRKPASRLAIEFEEIARRLYDPGGLAAVVDVEAEGFGRALARSAALLETSKPIFEAGVCRSGCPPTSCCPLQIS